MKMNKSGFSLVEILIALFIVAVMGGVGVGAYMAYKKSAQNTAAKGGLRKIQGDIDLYEQQVHELPETLDELVKAPADETKAKNWGGPYAQKKELKDPWGKAYQYKQTPDEEHPYELYSNGPKGKSDKKGKISVWDL